MPPIRAKINLNHLIDASNRPAAKPFAKYTGKDLLKVQHGTPHPYLSYPTMGVPLAAFIQYWREK